MLAGGNGILYHIQVKNGVNHKAFVATSNTMHLWHRRIGHLNSNMINTMHWQGIVKGLTIESPLAFDHLCSSCAHRKSYQLSLSK